jgi:hypothetical protein
MNIHRISSNMLKYSLYGRKWALSDGLSDVTDKCTANPTPHHRCP